MSIPKLQRYIDEFRAWINQHRTLAIEPGQADLFNQWSEELADVEQMLAVKPELPIAFLGPSQQGKSSLINALIGENVLAVGGAIGACTCVITSVHYRAGDGFKAEIDFISLEDWRAELETIQGALSAAPLAGEDTRVDQQELSENRQAALEKFQAVYRIDSAELPAGLLDDPSLRLPENIAEAMRTGAPIIVEAANAQTFRNAIRRYLVGRDQTNDGQYWPLISRVRIYGDFEVLQNGIVLVDLPGLNDPNPAREQVTKKYLEEARYLWLICNSGIGIDRVFSEMLRENGFLFRLFIEGRLNAFSVVATRVDDINLAVVLQQMGKDPQDYDGDYTVPLEFRRREIAARIQSHLLSIASGIADSAESPEQREAFLDRIRTIPAFSISSSAYLHATGRMPLYQGMKLTPEESHIPRLLEHLRVITMEHSYKMQVEASSRRLQILYEQARHFFLEQIRRLKQDDEEARHEWAMLCQLAAVATEKAQQGLQRVRIRAEESLQQRCDDFESRLTRLNDEAANSLDNIFATWGNINWRSLQTAVKRRGEWFSPATRRDLNLNRDIARAYLDLLPFIWDEFFGAHLSSLIAAAARDTQLEIQRTADHVIGGLGMLHHQPSGVQESLDISLRTAGQSLELQSKQVAAALQAQIQRTRQSLSSGMVEAAAAVMQRAYELASEEPAGVGIKQRILNILIQEARDQAPQLFINMRQELSEGVAVLRASMKPQLSRMVENGERVVHQFQQNMANREALDPQQRERLRAAFEELPKPRTAAPPQASLVGQAMYSA